jgi:Ca2+-binding EF-hand superfamily protein
MTSVSSRQRDDSESKKELNSLKRIIVKMELENKPIYKFLEDFLLAVKDPSRGVMGPELISKLDKEYGKILSKPERMELVKTLDQNLNGSIEIIEIRKFFLNMSKQSKEKILSLRLLLITLAKTLQVDQISTSQYFENLGLNTKSKCALPKFQAKMTLALEIEDNSEAVALFDELDLQKNGTVDMIELIQQINSFRTDSLSEGNNQLKVTTNKPQNSQNAQNTLNTSVDNSMNKSYVSGRGREIMAEYITRKVEGEPDKELKLLKRIIVKLELGSKPVYQILIETLKIMVNPKSGLVTHQLRTLWTSLINNILTKEELEALVYEVDHNRDGSLDIKEVLAFIVRNAGKTKETIVTTELFLLCVARLAQHDLLTTEMYVQNLGILLKKMPDYNEFKEKMNKIFKLPKEIAEEVLQPFNFNQAGYVEIDLFIEKVNLLRTDLKPGSKKIDSSAANKNPVLVNYIGLVVNESGEQTEKEKRLKDEELLGGLRATIREQKVEPLEFWEQVAQNKLTCSAATIQMALMTGLKVKMNKKELTGCVKVLDLLKNGSVAKKDYEILMIDDKGMTIFEKHDTPRGSEDHDEEVVKKVKDLLSKVGKDIDFLFRECDTMARGEIDIMQLKTGVQNVIPYSKLSLHELVRFIKSLDTTYTGKIQEDEFFRIMGGSKSDGPKPKILKNTGNDPRAEIYNPSKIQTMGEAQPNDLKDALLRLKVFLTNPKNNMKPQQLFAKFDVNNNGIISREEFMQALDILDTKIFLSERQKALLLNQADKNRNNSIEYEEFTTLILRTMETDDGSNTDKSNVRNPASGVKKVTIAQEPEPQAIATEPVEEIIKKLQDYAAKKAGMNEDFEFQFQKVDTNGDQIINKEEFFLALDRLKLSFTKSEKETIYRLADLNQDGEIELQEFFDFMKTYEITSEISGPTKPLKNVDEEANNKSFQRNATKKLTKKATTKIQRGTTVGQVDLADAEAAEKAFEKYMAKVKIAPEDYFEGKSTILNDQIKCLKRCYEIVKGLEKAGGDMIWHDSEFGPNDPNDPEDHGKPSLYFDEPPLGYPDPEQVRWYRVPDISIGKPVFLDHGAQSNDVIQGQCGDCWLIGAFSVLATQDVYINGDFDFNSENIKEISDTEAQGMTKGMYCPMFHFLRKYGIYVIRFFKNYSWRYVIIDDKLPCFEACGDSSKPDLIFGKCRNPREFWVPMLEKAYAKLHNCYEALIAGYLDDGLTDMTGLVSYKYNLHGPKGFPSAQVGSAEELWQKLLDYRKNHTMMGCSVKGEQGETEHEVMVDDEPAGILKNHAYAIIDVIELPNPNAVNAHKSHRLLRIRNPWGRKEWNGKWSDGNCKLLENIPKLQAYLKERAEKDEIEEFDPEAEDGTFLMCFKDWRNIYHNLFCCINFPDEWSGLRIIESWTKENSGGTPVKPAPGNLELWAKNPQYVLELNNTNLKPGKKTTKIFVSLGQPDGRLIRSLKFPFKENINPACFTIAKLEKGEKKMVKFDPTRIKKLSPLKEYREIAVDIELENGTYVIVPSCQNPGETGNFFMNVYFECKKRMHQVL